VHLLHKGVGVALLDALALRGHQGAATHGQNMLDVSCKLHWFTCEAWQATAANFSQD
jgi:hypothetical protein